MVISKGFRSNCNLHRGARDRFEEFFSLDGLLRMHGMSAREAGVVLIVTCWTGASSNLDFVVRAAGQ